MNDLRYAFRQLSKSPGFTLVAVLTLALGIGINTGVFSVFKGVVLRPLAGVPDSRELVTLLRTTRGGDKLSFSYLELHDFQQRVRTLSGLEATFPVPFSLEVDSRAQRAWGEFATGGLHAMLGVKPFLGRMLQPEDDRFPGGALVVVLSHGYWQARFGGNPAIVGSTLRINGRAFTVVGVAAPGFVGTTVGFALDLFVPVAAVEQLRPFGGNGADFFSKRAIRSLGAVGRLQPGVSLEQARAEIAAIDATMRRDHPSEYEGTSATLIPIRESPFGAQTYVTPIFAMMMGMTALVLVIMCANVANLLLARAAARSHEIAVRQALGAGRVRLIRQFLTESLVLALLGGALGGLLALSTPDLLRSLWSNTEKVPFALNSEPDTTVLAFTIAASFASALLFGVLPAWQSSKTSLLPALGGGGTKSATARTWGRNVLVVAQVAVSIPLLVAAGLLLRSAQRQKTANFGFDPARIALLSIDLRPNGYDADTGRAFCERVQRELAALPGVEAVSLANQLPVETVPRAQTSVDVPGYTRPAHEASMVLLNIVTPDYFRTLRIPLVAGREFTFADRDGAANVAIVNETMARRYWPGQNPLGRTFTCWGTVREVVGVARDVKYLAPTESARPHFYLPQGQTFFSEMIVQLRTSGDPRLLLKPATDRIAQLDPRLPVFGVETMDDYLGFALSLSAFAADGLLLAGALGLTLTAMGVFGTISYTVSMRTREIGVRMALGANRIDVVRLVVNQGLWLAGIGATAGLLAAAAGTRALRSLLYETTTADPLTFAAVLTLVFGTTLIACWLPARRATRVNPIDALRAE